MGKFFRRCGLCTALLVSVLLAGCGSTREVWQPEQQVADTPLSATTCSTRSEAGWLDITLTTRVRQVSGPIERLTIVVESVDSTVDWENVGVIILYSLLGLLSIFGTAALYSLGFSWED